MVITTEAYAKLPKEERTRLRLCDLYDLPMTTTQEKLNIFIRKRNEDTIRNYKSGI